MTTLVRCSGVVCQGWTCNTAASLPVIGRCPQLKCGPNVGLAYESDRLARA